MIPELSSTHPRIIQIAISGSRPQRSSGTTSLRRDSAGAPRPPPGPRTLPVFAHARCLVQVAWPRQTEQLYLPAGKSFLFYTVYRPSRSAEGSPKRKHLSKVLSATRDADIDALLI